MSLFFKCVSLAFLVVTILPVIAQKEKTFTVPLIAFVCCFILIVTLDYLKPVISLLDRLQSASGMDHSVFTILLKITGIGIVSEIAILLCSDSGNSSLGKSIGFLSSVLVLWMSVPLIEDLLDLLGSIMDLQ